MFTLELDLTIMANSTKLLPSKLHMQSGLFSAYAKALKLKLPIDIQCELFDQLIVPVLLYVHATWGHQDIKHIKTYFRAIY
jgi:hypothetical protein